MRLLRRNLKKCGRPVTLIEHSSASTGNSHRGRDRSQDIKTVVEGTFIDFSKFHQDGVNIKSTDQQVIVDAEGLPDLSYCDEIQDGTVLWKIKNVKVHRSKDSILLYKFQARR